MTQAYIKYQVDSLRNHTISRSCFLEVRFDNTYKAVSCTFISGDFQLVITMLKDVVNGDYHFLLEFLGFKADIKDLRNPSVSPRPEPSTITFPANDSIMVMGFPCQKVELQVVDLPIEIWTTHDIQPNPALDLLTLKELPDFPLHIKMFFPSSAMEFKPIEIHQIVPSKTQFLGDYPEMSFSDFADETELADIAQNLQSFLLIFHPF